LKRFDVGGEMGFNNDFGIGRIGCASGNWVDEKERTMIWVCEFLPFFYLVI
jgi:hypothetical protein